MTSGTPPKLSRRERQFMDILYQRGPATVAGVMEALPDPPSYSAVRATLRVLEDKGHVMHTAEGPRYVYAPAVSPDQARRTALSHLLKTFFNGSAEQAVVTLLQMSATELSDDDISRLAARVRAAPQE
ncbi:MAG: BlaI/MecI/CopY family transcriptional regulator [Gemmatimonadetes bacterium]|nr:BlaI/MecI/CopY family transcriptional regulator [Gemmatimonadota bacterium]TDJ54535.1 MAG: BlaI/MecI/CopY family transcriptional regulator [Gemmatimonadota bacterium]